MPLPLLLLMLLRSFLFVWQPASYRAAPLQWISTKLILSQLTVFSAWEVTQPLTSEAISKHTIRFRGIPDSF